MLDERIIQSARDVLLTDALDRLGLRWEIDPSYRPRGNPDTKLVLVNDQFESNDHRSAFRPPVPRQP